MKIKSPKISVIIPTFNRADKLRVCLNSLVSQVFKEFEVLVCDDGSDDDTADVVHSFSGRLDILYLYSKNTGGPAAPRNRGLLSARAPYVAFLDSDDWWSINKLKISYETLNLGFDFVFHDLYRASKTNQKIFTSRVRSRNLEKEVFYDLLSFGNAILNSSVVVSRDLLLSVNGFSEDARLVGAEDFDCWLKISKLTNRFKKIPYALGYYWAGGGNLTSPVRTIMNLEFIESHYGKDLDSIFGAKGAWWILHAKGVAFYKLGNTNMAANNLKSIRYSAAPLLYYLHAKYLLFLHQNLN